MIIKVPNKLQLNYKIGSEPQYKKDNVEGNKNSAFPLKILASQIYLLLACRAAQTAHLTRVCYIAQVPDS